MMRELLLEIEIFKNWAKIANQSSGEWETAYPHWDRIYHCVNKLIETIPVEKWSTDLVDNFLYILARDNECEIIIDTLIEFPSQLRSFAKRAVTFPEHDTRWQIAYGLGELKENDQEIKSLLKMFLHDEQEYVRKRAAFAFERKGYKL